MPAGRQSKQGALSWRHLQELAQRIARHHHAPTATEKAQGALFSSAAKGGRRQARNPAGLPEGEGKGARMGRGRISAQSWHGVPREKGFGMSHAFGARNLFSRVAPRGGGSISHVRPCGGQAPCALGVLLSLRAKPAQAFSALHQEKI